MVHCKRSYSKALIVLPFVSSTVSAFGISFFSPGFAKNAGSTTMVVFTPDSPKLVNFKIAVQNPDNTLSSIESNTAYNVATNDFTSISIPKSVEPGINYWFVAVDTADASHFATIGPFAINALFATGNPSSSIAASGGTAYQTQGGSGTGSAVATGNSTPTSASFTSTPTPTGSGTTATGKGSNTTAGNRNTPTSTSSNDNSRNDNSSSSNPSSSLSTGAIAGITVGGAVVALVVLWRFYCCFCATAAVARPINNSNNNNNDNNNNNGINNNESSIPMTSNPGYSSSPSNTANKMPATPPKTDAVPAALPQQQPVEASPINPQYQPASSATTSPTLNNTNDYSFSPTVEQTYNYQNGYPQQQQQGYPSYPYPQQYNPNQHQQGFAPYPTHDSMPVPDQFVNQAYSSPPMNQNYNSYSPYQQLQACPPFNLQQQQQQNYYPYAGDHNSSYMYSDMGVAAIAGGAAATATAINGVATGTSTKIERNNSAGAGGSTVVEDTLLSQKVEYDGVRGGKEAEYLAQKPDDTTAVKQQKQVYNKPDDAAAHHQNNKPHEREI